MDDLPRDEVVVIATRCAFFLLPEMIPLVVPYLSRKSATTSLLRISAAISLPPSTRLNGGTAPITYPSRIYTRRSPRSFEFQPIHSSRALKLKTGSPNANRPTSFLEWSSHTRYRIRRPNPYETGTLHSNEANRKRSDCQHCWSIS